MRRDPMTVGVTFLLPVIYLIVFGFAIRTDVRHQSTVVFDQSRSEESRNFLAAMTASGYFDLRCIAWSYDELNERIERGAAKIGIVFPPDLVREANAGHTVPIQAIVDASDSIASTSAIAALTGLGMRVQPVAVRGAPVAAPAYDVRIRVVQPRCRHRLLHAARTHGHHPHDHNGAHGLHVHRARTRGRHT